VLDSSFPTAYLARIGYAGSTAPTAATLRELQRAHLYHVPFENLDISLGRPIRLDEDALFAKIVSRRRGGFCYELNGLFARLLEALGFAVTRLNARGIHDDGSYSIEFDHLALAVRAPADPAVTWLVDVGWGNGPLEPLRLFAEGEQRQGERVFRLRDGGGDRAGGSTGESGYRHLEENAALDDGSRHWIGHYAFTMQPHALEDFSAACVYQQTSPQSIFTRKRMCTLYLPDGRVTLADLRLITTRDGVREERDLPGEDAARQALKDLFGVVF
jgi:N-hydroxyarylamine O-acetyltransferase